MKHRERVPDPRPSIMAAQPILSVSPVANVILREPVACVHCRKATSRVWFRGLTSVWPGRHCRALAIPLCPECQLLVLDLEPGAEIQCLVGGQPTWARVEGASPDGNLEVRPFDSIYQPTVISPADLEYVAKPPDEAETEFWGSATEVSS